MGPIQIEMQYQFPSISRRREPVDDAVLWCEEKFGVSHYPIDGSGRWGYIGMGKFSFMNEEDAVLFALRWK